MSQRWQHLDREPPPSATPPKVPAAMAEGPEIPPKAEPTASGLRALREAQQGGPVADPRLAGGWAQYRLGDFQAAADAAEAVLVATPEAESATRLLGLSLGHLPHSRKDAVKALRQAVAATSEDALLSAALLSAEVRAGDLSEPLPEVASPTDTATRELHGAVAWARGQRALAQGDPRKAVEAFQEAVTRFRSTQAHFPPEQGERLAAAYVGLATAQLLCGQWEAAQRAYGITVGRKEVPSAVGEFARRMYEVVDAVLELPETERAEAVAPLATVLEGITLHLEFYDGSRPVTMFWKLAG